MYSTDPAWTPPREPAAPKQPAGAAPGGVRMRLERKGRGGKAVTVLWGLPGPAAALADLARELKAACGAGGTLKGSEIEIQGDQRDRLEAYLSGRGFKVKRSGG